MNFLDLFSGIGGFRLGAEWAGMTFEHEFHSDIEPFPNKIYAKHFPNSIQLGDIKKITKEMIYSHIGGCESPSDDWIITGGFP